MLAIIIIDNVGEGRRETEQAQRQVLLRLRNNRRVGLRHIRQGLQSTVAKI